MDIIGGVFMDLLKIYSSVSQELERNALFKGLIIAGFGVLLLAYSGAFIPETQLKIWGLPILIVSSLLIALGLMPYKRLNYLSKNPSELILSEDYLQYVEKNKRQITIPLSCIKKAAFLENQRIYGIGLWFQAEDEKRIVVHEKAFNLEKRLKESQKEFGCDLFFPFFTRRSFSHLGFLNREKDDLDT